MLGRWRLQRYRDRLHRLGHDYARQAEFIEDRFRWRKVEHRVMGDLIERDEEVRAALRAPSPTTEEELRGLLALRRRVRDQISEEAARVLSAERAEFTAAVLAEADRLLRRLSRLNPPDELAAEHADVVTAFERHREALAGLYAVYDDAPDHEEVVEAWLRANAAGAVAEARLEAAVGDR